MLPGYQLNQSSSQHLQLLQHLQLKAGCCMPAADGRLLPTTSFPSCCVPHATVLLMATKRPMMCQALHCIRENSGCQLCLGWLLLLLLLRRALVSIPLLQLLPQLLMLLSACQLPCCHLVGCKADQ
jgi:hypothetical protein